MGWFSKYKYKVGQEVILTDLSIVKIEAKRDNDAVFFTMNEYLVCKNDSRNWILEDDIVCVVNYSVSKLIKSLESKIKNAGYVGSKLLHQVSNQEDMIYKMNKRLADQEETIKKLLEEQRNYWRNLNV